MSQTKILIIEDEKELLSNLQAILASTGFQVQACRTGQAATKVFAENDFDIVILDWMLPDIDGLTLLRHWRQISPIPILMLTARDSEAERVLGLESGADDYLVKPFSSLELVARIQAVLRRIELVKQTITTDRIPEDDIEIYTYGMFKVNITDRHVYLENDLLMLTDREFELLALFVRYPGRAFSREYLLDSLWNHEVVVSDRSVDNTILRLRRKLGKTSSMIETIRGHGYRLK